MAVPDFRLEPGRCALLVNDLQQRTVDPNSPAYAPSAVTAVERLRPLLDFCHAHDIPVVMALLPPDRSRITRLGDEYLTVAHAEPAAGLGRAPTDFVFEKPLVANGPWPISGLWHGTPVDAYLRERGRDTVLIAGGTLQYGVDTAVREANNRGFFVAALRDCCFVRAIPDHGWGPVAEADVKRVVLSTWAQWFARLLTAAEALAELQVPGA
jgi:nicotinamidase-related amidase